jgi:hypothetical protein
MSRWWRRERPPTVTEAERREAQRLRNRVDRVHDRAAKEGEKLTDAADAFAEVVRRAMRGRPV